MSDSTAITDVATETTTDNAGGDAENVACPGPVTEIVADKSLLNERGIALIVESLLQQAREQETGVPRRRAAKKQKMQPGLRTGLRMGLSC